MISATLTKENLEAILKAMENVKPIDRSEYFNNYFAEVKHRLYCIEQMENGKESVLEFHNFLLSN